MDRETSLKQGILSFISELKKQGIEYKSMERAYEFESSPFVLKIVASPLLHLSCYNKISHVIDLLHETTNHKTRLDIHTLRIFDSETDYLTDCTDCTTVEENEVAYC